MIKWLFQLITKTKFWDWFLSSPMAHFKLRLWDYPSFPMEEYHKICEILKEPGHYAFVGSDTRSFSFLVNHMVTGAKWAHAGIIMCKPDTPPRLFHSIVTGVCTWDLLSYLREVDNFAIIKITFKDEASEAESIRRLNWYLANVMGLPYDNSFDLGDRKAFYCSELVYALCEGLVDHPHFEPDMISGMPFFAPDNVYEVGEVVFNRSI